MRTPCAVRRASETGRCPPLDLDGLLTVHERRKRRSFAEETTILNYLQAEGFPSGLAQTFLRNTDAFAVRIWLVNNAGSMNKADGHLVLPEGSSSSKSNKMKRVDCTRWEEVSATVFWHATVCCKSKASLALRLVNDPGTMVGEQHVLLGASENVPIEEETKRLRQLFRVHPGGNVPMTHHLEDVLQSLRSATLLQDRLMALVLVTDSLPVDTEGNEGEEVNQELVELLHELQRYPVQTVIRLSTDDERVVAFYKQLDLDTSSARLDVVDDYWSEAQRVHSHNPWLTYGHSLHLCRESCLQAAEFDALNDRPLRPFEIANLIALLLGRKQNVIPNPATDYPAFKSVVTDLMSKTPQQFDPLTKSMQPWVKLSVFDKVYGGVAAFTACACTLL